VSILFISHRSTDKVFADLFSDFLLRCGVKSDHIFCSSLPGNDIKIDIPAEIKSHLQCSIVNIILLSADYYKSPYCMNEEGIIWYLDVPKIVIALPEINENLMEGFLNNDNKIRRLDSKQDISAISDILRPLFPDFTSSVAKLNENITKLIEAYKTALHTRILSVPDKNQPKTNSLEDSILEDRFIAEELAALRYMYDTKTDVFKQYASEFIEWVESHGIQITSSICIADYLKDANIATTIWNLMKLSKKALDFMDESILSLRIIENSTETTVNNIEPLIENGFTDNEMLFIKYALDSERVRFMCGWRLDQELRKIKAWEDVSSINRILSNNYEQTLEMLFMRKIIVVSELTISNKEKEYKLTDQSTKSINSLSLRSMRKLDEIVRKYKITETDEEMPF